MRPLNSRGQTAQSNYVRRGKAKKDIMRCRQPLGDISKCQARTGKKVKWTKPTRSNGNDISVLSKELATNHAKVAIIKNSLEEAERGAQSTAKKLHCEQNKRLTSLEGNLVAEQLANKLLRKVQATNKDEIFQLKATMLQKDNEATALKDEVATNKAKYETLASDHENIIANSKNTIATLESSINQKAVEKNKIITSFETKISLLRYENIVHLNNTKRILEEDHKDKSKISQLEATMLQKDHKATALKDEVATIEAKYETIEAKYKTLASDHANLLANSKDALATLESSMDQMAEELNDSNAQISHFKVQISTLTKERDQLTTKLDEENQGRECVVCKESRKEYAFSPCMHMCVCEGCAASIRGQDSKCPLCRNVSTSIKKIFH
jgi:chromosome segregation ATPase